MRYDQKGVLCYYSGFPVSLEFRQDKLVLPECEERQY